MSERCKFKLGEDSNCGSYQFNLHQQGIEQGTLCDVHYWQARVAELEALLREAALIVPGGFEARINQALKG